MEKSVKYNSSKRKNGFTIIELLIYISIVTVVVTVLTNFILDVTKSASSSKIAKEVQQNARTLMSKIMRDVRRADTIAFTDCVSDVCRELRLTVVETPGDPPVTIGFYLEDSEDADGDDDMVYFYTGTRPVTPIAANAISTGDIKVSDLDFSPLADSVIIDITVEPLSTVVGSGGAYSLTSTFVPRKNVY